MYSVYKHTTPTNKVYIGITSCDPQRRWKNGNGYKNQKHFYSAIEKYGWDNIKHEILFSMLSKEDACIKEKELIEQFKSYDRRFGYNSTYGGESYEFTDEVKQMLKENHSHCWRGRKHTEEQKENISKANKGRIFTDEHKNNIRKNHSHHKSFQGKKHTEESKRKISEHHFRYYGEDNPSARQVRCIETGETFKTIKEAADRLGLNRSHISSCCTGNRKTTGGKHFEYADKAS